MGKHIGWRLSKQNYWTEKKADTMCMICNKFDFKRKVSKEDIHCYKVMRYQDGEYYTPYLDMCMELNVRYDNCNEEDVKYELNNSDIWFRNWKEYAKIKSGFFHSFSFADTKLFIDEALDKQ